MPVRIGVIGVGVMGAEHVRLLSQEVSGCEVSLVSDVDSARAADVAMGCAASVQDDPMTLIKDDAVDAVLIASSDHTHEQFVLAALAARKPVLCEKPLAYDVAGCVRILDAEADVGRRLVSVGFMRRYDPGYLALKEAVTSGRIGDALMMHCSHRNAVGVPGADSSLLITGSAVHEIDSTRWLLGEELAKVTVHRPKPSAGSGGTQDPLLLIFESVSGVLIDVEVFVNAGYGYEVRCEVVAEGGTVSLDSPLPTVLRCGGSVARSIAPDWRPRFAEAYRRQLQDWVRGIERDAPSGAASAWDGYVATQVAQAGVRALETGEPHTVTLRNEPALYR